MDLPTFPHYADPWTDDCFEPSPAPCACCGQHRGLAYVGTRWGSPEAQDVPICPWCLADGRAAAQFGLEFQDTYFTEEASAESRRRVLTCTPGVRVPNPVTWPDHCGECAEYLGMLSGQRHVTLLSDPTLQADLREIMADYGESDTVEEFLDWAGAENMANLFLFRCVRCSAHRVAFSTS